MTPDDLQRMSHVMRHRLRNIAAGLRGSLMLVEEEVVDLLPSGLAEYFPLIYRECDGLQALAQRMSLLFDDLPDIMPCAVDEAVQRVLADVSGRFPMISFRLKGECSDTVDGSMETALTELLLNACEAAPSGVVELRLERRESRVHWTVLDNGSGLDENSEEINPFAPFMTTRSRHLGLGLPIARRLCEKEGGACKILLADANDIFSTAVEMSALRR